MHPLLNLTMDHVQALHKEGVRSLAHVKAVVEQAVRLNRAKQLYPELSRRAGLCQRVIVNKEIFNVMMHWCINHQTGAKRPVAVKRKKK